jgi:multidrug efflux pump subunit AcrA (membrane-fusion protein)
MPPRRLLSWLLLFGTLGVLLVGAYFLRRRAAEERAREGGEAVQAPRRAKNAVVKLSPASAEAMGLAVEPAAAVSWRETRTVYGRVVPNPDATAEVRAPAAGTLRVGPGQSWPAPGARVREKQPLGWIDVRVTPQERLDLETKLSDARVKQQGAETVCRIQEERVARFEKSPPALARSEFEQAQVHLAEAVAQRDAARAAAKQYREALDRLGTPGDGPGAWSLPLTVPLDGEVAEVAARPGTNVEAGATLLRVTDPRALLVRLDLPADALADGPPPRVELCAAGAAPPGLEGPGNRTEPAAPAPTVTAVLVGQTPAADAPSQLLGFWYRVPPATPRAPNDPAALWRPGLFVKATLRTGALKQAVAVPDGALLYHQGRALVYARIDPNRYERREVRVLGRDGHRWVLAEGVAEKELVVSRRAQALLSEEFRGDVDND